MGDADNGPLLLDAYGFRVVAIVAAYVQDGAALLAQVFAEHAAEIAVSPEVGHFMTGLSAKALRGAINRGEMPSIGAGKHRYIPLRALVRRGLDVERGVTGAIRDLWDNSTHEQLYVAAPALEGEFADDRPPVAGPEALAGLLAARVEQLVSGR